MEINAKRLVENIKTLGRIGYEPEKGTTRPAYSKAYFEGKPMWRTSWRRQVFPSEKIRWEI